MALLNKPLILWDTSERHLEEAAFLWACWEQALVAPDHVLAEVESLEERLHAHMDGLVLAGEHVSKRLLLPALESGDGEALPVAAFALLKSGTPVGADAVLQRLVSADAAAQAILRRVLELLEPSRLPSWLQSLLREEQPLLQALAMEVLGQHQLAPAAACHTFAEHEAPEVAAAAIRAAARCRVKLSPAVLDRALASPVTEVRDAAIETGLIGGHRSAWLACRTAIQSRVPGSMLPLLVLAIAGNEREMEELQALLSVEKLQPGVIWSLGFSGRIACADTCLDLMKEEPLAALAGEAFSAITGLHIEGRYAAQGSHSESPEPPPLEEEDLDADLVPRPTDALPLPQLSTIAGWWQQTRPHMARRQRYLEGALFGPQALLDALTLGSMRRRHVLALELAIRSRGAYQLPTCAFAKRQAGAMRMARKALPHGLDKGFRDGLF